MPFLLLDDGRYVPVEGDNFTIGADAACDLTLVDDLVAPRQAILQSDGEIWRIATLHLLALTTLNGDSVTSISELHEGDRLRLGNTRLVWSFDEPRRTASRDALWPLAAIALIVLLLVCVLAARLVFRPIEDTIVVNATPPPPPPVIVPAPEPEHSSFVSAPTYLIVVPKPVLPERSPGKPPLYRLKIPPGTPRRDLSVSHPVYRIKVTMPEEAMPAEQ